MARYSGWNVAEVRNGDISLERDRESIRAHIATSPARTLRSLTPVNNSQPTSPITSYSKARPRGLDGDRLFDLPDEPLVHAPVPRGRKRKLATSSNLRQSRKSSRTLTSQCTLEAGPSQPNTLPASEKFSGSLSISKQSELFPNANIKKPISTVPVGREASFNAADIVIAKSTIEKLSTFRFQAHQPSSFHSTEVGSDPCPSRPTPPVVNNVLGGYSSSGFKNGLPNKLPPAHNVAFNSDFTYRQDVQDVFRDVRLSNYQNDIVLAGNQSSSIAAPVEVSDLQLDSNDEFPMDFEDEVEMAQLPLFDKVINANTPKVSERPISISSQLQSEEFDDGYHEFSTPNSRTLGARPAAIVSTSAENMPIPDTCPMLIDVDDCSSVRYGSYQISTSLWDCRAFVAASPWTSTRELSANKSFEYLPLPIFARPNFPSRVLDRSPIDGVSANPFSRICFRIGELIREGGYWGSLGQDTVIELFARVYSSSREAGTSKQLFQFADLFHDHPPFPNGVLENCKAYGLQETESRQLVGPEGMGQMVRCIGRWKRVLIGAPGWMFHIINIRATDWEEIRWTKEIVGARMAFCGP